MQMVLSDLGSLFNLGISLLSLAVSAVAGWYARRAFLATNVPALRLYLEIRDESNDLKSPQTFFDLEIKNLHRTISITDVKASLNVVKYSKLWRLRRKQFLSYYRFHDFKILPPIEAASSELINSRDARSSLEDFLIANLPSSLQEHKETFPPHVILGPDTVDGSTTITEPPVTKYQYHHPLPIGLQLVVRYRVEVAGASARLGKVTATYVLAPRRDEGATKLTGWFILKM
jgi:hypothetical protein